jgi:shikimate dehydrogenase
MHNTAFESLGLNYCYVPFLVHPESLEQAVQAIRALDLRGVNVTVPHKESVMYFLDVIHEEASFIGAVNTIVNDKGLLTGYNTDGRGFMQSLSEEHIAIDGKDVLIVGAGGASRAVSYYLAQKAKNVSIYGRTRKKAEKLVHDLKQVSNRVSFLEELSDIDRYDIIINATPLGLKEDDPMPVEASRIGKNQVICDLIYKKTRLLREASQKGCTVLDGLGMLLWQGMFAFELWTGLKPDINIMREALLKKHP